MGEEPSTRQMRFEGGRLVAPDDDRGVALDAAPDSPETTSTGSRTTGTDSETTSADPETTSTDSRTAADPGTTAAGSTDGLTYEVTDRDALAVAVVTTGETPPVVERFVRRDLDLEDDEALTHGLRVRVLPTGAVAVGDADSGDLGTWEPDCKIEARDGWNGDRIAEYWCAVAADGTDDAGDDGPSAAMRRHARTDRVLTVRVNVADLPDRYGVDISTVGPDGHPGTN